MIGCVRTETGADNAANVTRRCKHWAPTHSSVEARARLKRWKGKHYAVPSVWVDLGYSAFTGMKCLIYGHSPVLDVANGCVNHHLGVAQAQDQIAIDR